MVGRAGKGGRGGGGEESKEEEKKRKVKENNMSVGDPFCIRCIQGSGGEVG